MILLFMLLAVIASFLYGMLLSKYGKLWRSIPETEFDISAKQTVSIVVPFRNEEVHLEALLRSLRGLVKTNIDIEVLLIDDHSADRSLSIIEDFSGELNLKVLSLQGSYGKKEALKLGWKSATSEIIVQTDADCVVQADWLTSMLLPFQNSRVMLASGPVKYFDATKFLGRVVEYDFLGLIAIGASHIKWKLPMICNGANLAYRKEVTESVNLLDSKASGDDVFLMQSVFNRDPDSVVFVKSKSAIVSTLGPKGFDEFWNQRLRWASKNGDYDVKKNTYILLGLWLYNLLILGAFLSYNEIGALVGFYLLVTKILSETTFYSKFMPF
ncbi:MAG: glycosyltransferase, partial [Bacteroidia bacterium]